MQIINITQGEKEWFEARKGIPTASGFSKIITPAKCEASKTASTYMYELIAERLGATNESFSNEHTERGNELEPLARDTFEFIMDLKVDQVGMVKTDCGKIGCSPDGLIGDDGGLEIKCPKASTHVKYLLEGKLPLEYKTQVMGSLMVTERKYWYFMSYHPELEPFIIKVERDEEYISKMREHIDKFNEEMEEQIKIIEAKRK
jgi:putative phage-type endonuclease